MFKTLGGGRPDGPEAGHTSARARVGPQKRVVGTPTRAPSGVCPQRPSGDGMPSGGRRLLHANLSELLAKARSDQRNTNA